MTINAEHPISKAKSTGRPTQYGELKVQTTVRLPQSVIDYLKIEYGKVQKGIDKLVIEPCIVAESMSAPVIHPVVVDEDSLTTVCTCGSDVDAQ